MYSSLNRVDIVWAPGEDGRRTYVQTDHRTAEEIEDEPALSVMFALVRMLNPKRMAELGEPEPIVMYSAQSQPPEFLTNVIRAAGAKLRIGSNIEPDVDAADPIHLSELIQLAFKNLAQEVTTEFGVDFTLDGLIVVEDALADEAGDPEENEIAYWTAVVNLGSFGGELIRVANGGHWKITELGTLPFALSTTFEGKEATVNPLGKAIKLFANGNEDSLVPMVNLILSQP